MQEEDIAGDQAKLRAHICDFLKIPDFDLEEPIAAGRPTPLMVEPADTAGEAEVGVDVISYDKGDLLFYRSRKLLHVVKNPSISLVNKASKVATSLAKITNLSRARQLEINNHYFREDIEALQKLINRDLSVWLQ